MNSFWGSSSAASYRYCARHGVIHGDNVECAACHAEALAALVLVQFTEDDRLLQIAADLDGVTPDVMTLIDAIHRCGAARLSALADDTRTRFSVQHSLLRDAESEIAALQQAEDRQDRALTEIESAVAELGALYDRITQLERRVEEIGRAFATCNVRMWS